MKPRIDATNFGSITIEGTVFDHDVVICPDGEVSKRKSLARAAASRKLLLVAAERRCR